MNKSSLLLSFANPEKMDEFLQAIEKCIDKARDEALLNNESIGFILQTFSESVVDPPLKRDDERMCSLFVCGEMVHRGFLADLHKRFEHEVSLHSGSVEIREDTGNGWKVLRSRSRRNAQI